jgi:60kDa lysophospholipase
VSTASCLQQQRPGLTTSPVCRYAVIEFEELLDSSSIDSKGWTQIAKTIARNYILFDGFVVLHGTDSLAYTCSALSFMLQNLGKPVILTGSQIPFFERRNDALDNLLNSLDIAGHFMIPEVCLCFNSKLYRGNRTTKISASAFDAFASPNLPPLATITALDMEVTWDLVSRPTTLAAFSIQTNLDTNHVACLRIFPGIRPEMVEAVLRTSGLRGLILETFGAGNAPSGVDNAMTNIIRNAVDRGIVIVNVTQCLTGSVNALYAPGMVLGRAGVVAGGDMTTEAALTKLAYLLALPGAAPDAVARDMSTPLRGEMTANTKAIFSHPNGSLTSQVAKSTALAYAISAGDVQRTKDLLQAEPSLLNKPDYSGNTPLHLAATGPSVEILRYFLTLGASVHMRNFTAAGRTPLFLAANAGLLRHVMLLRTAGAHLHTEELETAQLHARQQPDVWEAAGISVPRLSEPPSPQAARRTFSSSAKQV